MEDRFAEINFPEDPDPDFAGLLAKYANSYDLKGTIRFIRVTLSPRFVLTN